MWYALSARESRGGFFKAFEGDIEGKMCDRLNKLEEEHGPITNAVVAEVSKDGLIMEMLVQTER